MSSFLDSPRLPVIDISLLERGDPWRDHVAAQIDWAAGEFGFFYIVGQVFEAVDIDTLLRLCRHFFDQDIWTKQQLHRSRSGCAWRGYLPVGAEPASGRPDLKEGLSFGGEFAEEDVRARSGGARHDRNLFADLPGFRELVLDYMRAMTGLSHKLMASIGRGLRLGDHYFVDRYTGRPTTLLRIFNYPDCRSAGYSDACGAGEHTDHGLLTVLYQDEACGLQVKYGSAWLDVPYVPGSFVVNVGDVLERLTSGRYTSAPHRVINSSGRARLSMPFFFDPAFDAILQPIAGVAPSSPRPGLIERRDGSRLNEGQGTCAEYPVSNASRVFPEPGRIHR